MPVARHRCLPLHWIATLALVMPSCAASKNQRSNSSIPIAASGVARFDDHSLHELVEHANSDLNALASFYNHAPTATALARRQALLDDWLERLRQLDYGRLAIAGQIDYHLLRAHLDFSRTAIDLENQRLAEMAPLIEFAAPLLDLEEKRRRLQHVDVPAAAQLFDRAAQSIDKLTPRVTSTLATTPSTTPAPTPSVVVTPIVAARAARHLEKVRRDLQTFANHYANYDPEGAWWLRTPHARLDGSLQAYIKRLREEVAGQRGQADDPLIGDPIGEKALRFEIAREMLAYDPQELLAIGHSQLRWCERELQKAARELGQDDWKKALEVVKTRHVAPGQQAALVAQQAGQAIEFLDRHELVTIPPLARELWRLEMSPAEKQRYLPFASYDYQYMSVGYPTDAMSHEQKLMSMRANNVHFSRNVTPHELIPGHHLQHFMAARYQPHRRMFYTPFFVEGWAVHWEILFWQLGYPQSPHDRIGVLFWRMHRAMRIIVSLQYHLGQMDPAQMVAFLVDHGHEKDAAISEVRRYIDTSGEYGPLYQAGYLVGALQIQDLHQQLVSKKKWTQRHFHDALLQQGPIANVLIRAALLQENIPREGPKPWRFAEEWLTKPADAAAAKEAAQRR